MTDSNKKILPTKDDRPFYKKKRVLIPACFLFIALVGIQMDEDKKSGVDSNATSTAAKQELSSDASSVSPPGMDLKTKVANTIKSIDGDDDLTKSSLTSATDFQITAAIYKAYAMTIYEGKASADTEVLKLTAELERKVIVSQKKNFPKIRKAYYDFVKEKLWENDVDVDLSGAGNTVIKFTGAYFAANKNIKETQEVLYEMLQLLRFKQTQYRWYKGQDEYTYFTIASSKDSEIAE